LALDDLPARGRLAAGGVAIGPLAVGGLAAVGGGVLAAVGGGVLGRRRVAAERIVIRLVAAGGGDHREGERRRDDAKGAKGSRGSHRATLEAARQTATNPYDAAPWRSGRRSSTSAA